MYLKSFIIQKYPLLIWLCIHFLQPSLKVQIQTLNSRHPLSYVIIYIALIYKKFICRFQTLTIFKDTRAYTTSRDVLKYLKKTKLNKKYFMHTDPESIKRY